MSDEMTQDKLIDALAEAQRQIDALRLMNRFSDKPMIVMRHSGHGPQVIIPVEGGDPVVLDPRENRNFASVPVSDYNRIRKNTNWFELAYIYTDEDLEGNNPNLVLNADQWVSQRSEKQIVNAVQTITSRSSLDYLYNYTETAERNAKTLTLRDATARRMEDLFDIVMIEDNPQDEVPDDAFRFRR